MCDHERVITFPWAYPIHNSMHYVTICITLVAATCSLLPGFGSVYDGMGRLNEQGLPRLKGEAVPHK